MIFVQKLFPVGLKLLKGGIYRFFRGILFQHGVSRFFIDNAVGFPFVLLRIFNIAKDENKGFAFSRRKGQPDMVGSYGGPAACNGVGAEGTLYCNRGVRASVSAKEGISACIKAVNRSIDRVDGVMVTALSVFGFMENGGAGYFHFSGT